MAEHRASSLFRLSFAVVSRVLGSCSRVPIRWSARITTTAIRTLRWSCFGQEQTNRSRVVRFCSRKRRFIQIVRQNDIF